MSTLVRRFRAARKSGDTGVTLSELVVAMSIMGILISLVAVVVVQAYRLQGSTIKRENDTTDAQIVMDTMSRSLRMATYLQDPTSSSAATSSASSAVLAAFTQTTPTSVTFTTSLGADPTRVTYSVVNGVLSQTVVAPLTAGQGLKSTFGTSGTTRVLARNVVTSSSAPLFSYYYVQSDGTLSTTAPTTTPMKAVRQVRIQLTLDSDASGKLAGTTLDSTVVNQNLARL